jgi:membrane dipeptidase
MATTMLLRLWSKTSGDDFLNGDGQGHLDLPRMVKGGFAGGFFAIFAPNPQDHDLPDDDDSNPPPAGQVGQAHALNATIGMASLLFRIEAASNGAFKICRTAAELRAAMEAGQMAAIFHIEGAEAIDAELRSLDVLRQAFARSAQSGAGQCFGHGVPFPH